MSKLLKSSCYLIVLLLFTGCSIIPEANYTPIKYYDFGRPTQVKSLPITLDIKDFIDVTPIRKQMIYRKNNTELQPDAYNQWGATPPLLVTQYLEGAIIGSNGEKHIKLSGTLISIDIDLDKDECRMVVQYSITLDKTFSKTIRSFTKSYKQPFSKDDPLQFAKAFEKIMGELTDDIIDDINTSIK